MILCPNCHAMTTTFSKNKNLSAQREIFDVESCKFKEPLTINKDGNLELSCKYTESAETKHRKSKPIKIHKHICPNCNKEFYGTLKQKFCSKTCACKSRTKLDISLEILEQDFKELKTYTKVAEKYKVSDKAIKKYVMKLGIIDIIKQYL